MRTFNIVFEGGGVKGIGLVGALSALMKGGINFSGLAGTSAGAIVAALTAAGFQAVEMKDIISNAEFGRFKEKSMLDRFGPLGSAFNIFIKYGIYSSNYFERWLSDILAQKNINVFGDIKNSGNNMNQRYKFQAIASDITAKRILVLPDDLVKFGIDIDRFSIAKAVTMSMSIPVFFEPYNLYGVRQRRHIIVDGAILSNYPLWLFDGSPYKTLSLRFSECDKNSCNINQPNDIKSFIVFLKHIAETMMEAHDKQHINFKEGDYTRTVFISPEITKNGNSRVIKTTQFDLDTDGIDALYTNGVIAGEGFVNRNLHKL